MQTKTNLLEIVGALDARGGLAHFLHGRNQQPDKNGYDGYHDQQFYQRETASVVAHK
jgi:hypothetical protein